MKKKIVSVFLLPLIALLSFQNFFNASLTENYEVYVNEIIRDFSIEMKKKHNLVCIGSGGAMPYDVERIRVNFFIHQKGNVDEARVLIVNATERLLEIINSHEKIRPFLRDYPFKAEGAPISISFNAENNTSNIDGSVEYIHQGKNKIFYRKIGEIRSSISEPYNEAKKIVEDSIEESTNIEN